MAPCRLPGSAAPRPACCSRRAVQCLEATGCRGGRWRPHAVSCSMEPAETTFSRVPMRAAAWECARGCTRRHPRGYILSPYGGLRTASAHARRRPRWTQAALPRRLLLTGAVSRAGVAGPVPLCFGDYHPRTVSPVSRKLYTYPVGTAGGEGLSGGGCNIPGTPSGANPGGLLVHLNALTNPGPSPAPLRAVQSFSSQRVKKSEESLVNWVCNKPMRGFAAGPGFVI